MGINQIGKRGSGAWYRCWLMTDGEEVVVDETNKNYHVKAKVGIPKEKMDEALAQGGLLTAPELLRCRIRYFTEGLAIGSKRFVEKWYGKNRGHFNPKREKGAKRIQGIIPKKIATVACGGDAVDIEATLKKPAAGSSLFSLKGLLQGEEAFFDVDSAIEYSAQHLYTQILVRRGELQALEEIPDFARNTKKNWVKSKLVSTNHVTPKSEMPLTNESGGLRKNVNESLPITA